MNAQSGFTYLADYKPTSHTIDSVELDVRLDPAKTRVHASVRFAPRPGFAANSLKLDGEKLSLIKIAIDGVALEQSAYSLSDDGLTLHGLPNAPFTLQTEVEINPEDNKSLMGLFLSNGVYCTQCEADGFRRISYFLDRPDVLTTYKVRLEAEKKSAPYLLSNGNLIEQGDLGNGRHFAIWHDPHPKPAYLFALVGGDFDRLDSSFTTSEDRNVVLQIFVEKGKQRFAHYAMDALKRSMKWDEERFGRAYDLDIFMIVAVSHFNMGAMENKGLNIFNDKFVLADPETATDTDYANIEAIIAHEYFHNWTGNRITCRDWFQLCLKEGLTVYRDQEFSADMRDREVQRIEDVRQLRAAQFPEDAGPLAHPVRPEKYKEINNFYTATVYEKGAELVRMLATLLGEAGFRKGMDLYFERHDGDAATIEDFLKCFADANSVSLDQFALWYAQAGTPELTIERKKTAAGLELTFSQSLPQTPDKKAKQPQVIPIKLSAYTPEGKSLLTGLPNNLFVLDSASKTLTLKGADENTIISALHGFSAPVTLKDGQDTAARLAMLAHDTDGFQRWQAAQSLSHSFIEARLKNQQQNEADFQRTMVDMMRSTSLSAAYRAYVLQTPSEQDIARLLSSNVDPARVHQVREAFTYDLGVALAPALQEVLAGFGAATAFKPTAAQAGVRALKLGALSLLAKADTAILPVVSKLYDKTDNMTERFGALGILLRSAAPDALEKLKAFEKRFGDNPIVLDKWFALQAVQTEDNVLQTLDNLMKHKGFALDNPNRVRAVVGTFAYGNPTQFHRADGKGYAFVADIISQIDSYNSQLSARLATAFGNWRRYTPALQHLAKAELEKLQGDNLSRDLSDILERTLQD